MIYTSIAYKFDNFYDSTQKFTNGLDRCSVEHLCRPLVLCRNKMHVQKGHNSIKCDLDLKNLGSS
jgi:hypothetical protein